MAGMLVMAAIEFGDPVIFLVPVKTDNVAFHCYCIAAFSVESAE